MSIIQLNIWDWKYKLVKSVEEIMETRSRQIENEGKIVTNFRETDQGLAKKKKEEEELVKVIESK